MMEMRNAQDILVGKPERKRPLEDLGIDWRKILKGILGKLGRRMWTGFIWLRTGISGGLL
jgi:hypothetical protein